MRRCAISVDLDEVPNYLAIHGVELDAVNRHAVYDVAVNRLVQWAARQRLPLTLFTVGADLERPENGQQLAAAAQCGHEIANHSYSHCYDLTRRSRSEQFQEVERAAAAIEAAVGARPTGFRAPGYTTTDELYSVLSEAKVGYSSSVFPCPSYYGAKVGIIALKQLLGTPSQSLVDTPRVLTAPTAPYRIGSPYWRPGQGLLEIPMQVTRRLRLPFIGTSITLGGPKVSRWLARGVVGAPLVNLELHGIDVLDAQDGLEALASHQKDVRIPLTQKLAALDAAVDELRLAGYTFTTLEQAAEHWRDA